VENGNITLGCVWSLTDCRERHQAHFGPSWALSGQPSLLPYLREGVAFTNHRTRVSGVSLGSYDEI